MADYLRKAAGKRNQSDVALNPIKIQRYYCASCQRTMSVLPECLPPHRWYLWSVQQVFLLLVISGANGSDIKRRTTLHHAALRRDQLWIEYLLEIGADATLEDEWGDTLKQVYLNCCKFNKFPSDPKIESIFERAETKTIGLF